VPFQLKDELYSGNLLTNSLFGNWTFGQGSEVFNPGGWHARLDYNYSNPQNYPCKNNGGQCQDVFDIPQLLRSDLNGVLSMEIQYRALNGGSINICGVPACAVSSQNMTVDASISIPHDTSSLQTSPSPSSPQFNQAYTVLEWYNLTSPIFLSYVSPHLLAQYQFFILTSGILISTGVAMEMDAIAKWIEARNQPRRDTSSTRREVQDNFL
jgi:hypothetical protein